MANARAVPKLIDRPMSFCPGCGHGIVIRLIVECLEELGQDKNVIYGIGVGCSSLLGGQMSNTTMPGQKTATSPLGRDCEVTGLPIKFPELVASQFNAAYVARGSVSKPAHIYKLKSYIKNALEAQLNGEGYSVVEVLSSCPTNWGMSAIDAMDRIEEELIPYFPLGEFKTREGK